MEKIKIDLIIVLVIFVLFLPLVGLAGTYKVGGKTIYYPGLIPCGVDICEKTGDFTDPELKRLNKADPGELESACNFPGSTFKDTDPNTPAPNAPSCQLCHLFVMIDGIWDWILKYIVIPVAVLMLTIGGFFLMTAAGDPGRIEMGKKILTGAVIGLVIIFAAFLIVGEIFNAIGVNEWTGFKDWLKKGFFQFKCEIKL